MKAVFIHNEKVKEDENGNYYTGGAYNQKIWDRYVEFSSDLTVMLKKEQKVYPQKIAEEKFNKFDKSKMKFIPLEDLYRSAADFLSIKNRKNIVCKIEKEVREADAVIIRSVASLACRKAIYYARKYNKPYILEVTGIAWRSLWFHDLKGKILAPFVEFWNHYYISKSPYLIYVTKEVLQKHYPSKGYSVGISDVEIPDMEETVLNKRLARIERKENSIIIGTIGNTNLFLKNQQLVMSAMRTLKEKGYHFEYQLVGYGDTARLKNIAKKYGVDSNVKFLGGIPHEKIFNWIDDIDIYIQPSKQEGMPRALIEAASRACPVIGSTVGGIPELVNEEYCFSPHDDVKLAKILEILSDKNELKSEAKRSYREAQSYQKSVLDKARNDFYEKFKSENELK